MFNISLRYVHDRKTKFACYKFCRKLRICSFFRRYYGMRILVKKYTVLQTKIYLYEFIASSLYDSKHIFLHHIPRAKMVNHHASARDLVTPCSALQSGLSRSRRNPSSLSFAPPPSPSSSSSSSSSHLPNLSCHSSSSSSPMVKPAGNPSLSSDSGRRCCCCLRPSW